MKNYFKNRIRKQWFALVLLGAFVALLLPRDWVHSCKHPTAHSIKETHVDQGACFICDVQLSAFTAPTFFFYHVFNLGVKCPHSFPIAVVNHLFVDDSSLRGPPEFT